MSEPVSFRFSTARVAETTKDLDLQISAIEAHIDKIAKLTEINSVPLLQYVLQLSHNQEDLERFADGLKKVAPHIAKLDELKRRKTVFDLAVNDPTWMQWAFGDFSEFTSELDSLTELDIKDI